ncbi:MAG: hypothetical protein GX780_00285 [Campylobacteraceae bacterium]|nr:hypothetical protein [Campylobacteraceae bacterium]
MKSHTYIIAKEGWLFLGVAIALWSLSLMFDFLPWVFLSIIVLVAVAYRNPERIPEEYDKLALISPIDGKIKEIKQSKDIDGNPCVVVRIQGAPYLASVVRAPFAFAYKELKRRDGLNLPLDTKQSSLLNTKMSLLCKGGSHTFWMEIKAGAWGKQIHFYQKEKLIRQAERIGFALGAEISLYLPISTRIRANEGEHIYGGESVFGYLQSEK